MGGSGSCLHGWWVGREVSKGGEPLGGRSAGWLDGWMAGWVDGWMAGWLGEWLDGWMGRVLNKVKGPRVGRIERWLNGWMAVWLDGWMAGWGMKDADERCRSDRTRSTPGGVGGYSNPLHQKS